MFPAIARYVRGYGYIEIGDQESFGFVVRAIGYGGLDFEDDTPETLAEADDQIGGQLAVGFMLTGFYEDIDPDTILGKHIPSFIATRAVNQDRDQCHCPRADSDGRAVAVVVDSRRQRT